jgi:ketosteroid isomerase-like protein
MTMTDAEIRDICNRFFDAYQDSHVSELEEILSDDCLIWTNIYGLKTRDENLALLPESQKRHRRRIYNDRRIDTFDGGFVIRYTLNIVEHSGRKSALWVCIVGLCSNGRITRIDEYIDPSKTPAWQERQKLLEAEAAAAGAQGT